MLPPCARDLACRHLLRKAWGGWRAAVGASQQGEDFTSRLVDRRRLHRAFLGWREEAAARREAVAVEGPQAVVEAVDAWRQRRLGAEVLAAWRQQAR